MIDKTVIAKPPVLTLLAGASSPFRAKKAGDAAFNSVIKQVEKNDPEGAAALRRKKAESDELLGRLQASKKDVQAERKEAARQKIQQLKAQLQALRMSSSADPKAAARQAARLARELAAAVKDYAGEGGSAAATAGTGAAAPQQQAAAANSATAAAPADAAAAETAAPAAATGETATVAPATTATLKVPNAEDTAFAKEVRGMMSELKRIMQAAKDRMKKGGEDNEIQQGEKALRDAEKMLQKMLSESTTTVSLATPEAGAGAAVPSVDITV